MLGHGFNLTRPKDRPDFFYPFWKTTWVGVDLFFVLSGFLITGILIETRATPKYFTNFYARRALRIFPLYYVCIAFLVGVAGPLGLFAPEEALSVRTHQAWYWTYSTNFMFALYPDLAADKVSGHLWSLAVEEQFYLLWPLVVARLDRERLRRAAHAIIVGAFLLRGFFLLLHASTAWIYLMLPSRADSLAWGALLAIWLREPTTPDRLRARLRVLGLAGLSVIALTVLRSHPHLLELESRKVQLFGYSALGALATAVIGWLVLALPDHWLRKSLQSALPRELGRISYGVYVIHIPVMRCLYERMNGDPRWSPLLAGTGGRLSFIACSVILTIVLARISWVVFERQILGLKRLFPYDQTSPAVLGLAVHESGERIQEGQEARSGESRKGEAGETEMAEGDRSA
jgi:peptidoglycan/LPS O-acetylase OafA/YrhL